MPDQAYDKVSVLASIYTVEELREHFAIWRQAEADYLKDADNTDKLAWWRQDRRKEAAISRLNAEAFEAALKLKEQA